MLQRTDDNPGDMTMNLTNLFFERPILNSPYEYPNRHWELDGAGQPTQKIIESRRPAEFITPIPKPRKRGRRQREMVFDEQAPPLFIQEVEGKSIRYVRFLDDFSVYPRTNVWLDVGGVQSRTDPKVYVVQTATEAVKRCILMTTVPGDLVLDPTCGSGTAAYVAEQWGRRWITIDTSRVALALARSRVMGARYPYFLLSDSRDGQLKEAEINRDAWATLRSDTSRPFAKPQSGRIVVKVINHLGDEVMKVFRV